MHSAIYRGWLRHRRTVPRAHALRLPLFMMYLDLAELPEVFRGRWLWSTRRPAFARFDRADHLGDPAQPLDAAVRDLVAERTGRRPEGPVRLLTHLRYGGYGFNPVSFYYCFDAAGEEVQAIVAEVTNTPWKQRHCYVLDAPQFGAGGLARCRSTKAMHVSPFMPMELAYDWTLGRPGDRLGIHMVLRPDAPPPAGDAPEGDPPPRLFDATLDLRRQPITGAALAGVLLRYPLMAAQVVAAIHWHALRLWLKRVPVHTHPDRRPLEPAAPLQR